jgi:DnaJ family protein C protein 13
MLLFAVEQVAILLYRIMADNPKLASLYTTGVFFFILMYTGSNLLPIGRFLAMSHDKQAFRLGLFNIQTT